MRDIAMKISGLTKFFTTNQVLRGVDLMLRKGEVTVLMGANGAGKSTLVKVISGVHIADGGTVELNGQPFCARTPREAIHAGVVTVHQNINDGVVPDLDIASNLLLDELARADSGFFLKRQTLHAKAREVAARIGLNVDVSRAVSELTLADRQLVSIARAMAYEPEILILDEPTSSLSAVEAERLFILIDRLRDAGVAILYISHRTSDIQRIADRIVCMRDGKIVGRFYEKPLDYEAAVEAMLGQEIANTNLTIKDAGLPVLTMESMEIGAGTDPINLSIYENQVVVFTGLVGSGKTALADILFGLSSPVSGKMTLLGEPYSPKSARHAIKAGVFLCPKDRATNGIIPDHNLAENISLPFLSHYSLLSFISRSREATAAQEAIDMLNIVCQSVGDDIGTLSGGNQQKVMVGRWLSMPCELLILDEPFQGVDIQARHDIGQKIRETSKGRATIIMAAELDEALEIADRIIVLSNHQVAGDHRNHNMDMKLLMAEVAGQQHNAIDALAKPTIWTG